MPDFALFQHTVTTDPSRATITIDVERKSPHVVNPRLYGKFTEHLGSNIYHGIDAQILRNPTFGKWRFGSGENTIDGGVQMETNQEIVKKRVDGFSKHLNFPATAALYESYEESLAYHWSRLGEK